MGGIQPSFFIEQRVQTSSNKKHFKKGSTQNWTEEIFRISDIVPGQPTTYRLKDLLDDEITGSFYKEQLRPTSQYIYPIERVLRRLRGQAFVKCGKKEKKFGLQQRVFIQHKRGRRCCQQHRRQKQ